MTRSALSKIAERSRSPEATGVLGIYCNLGSMIVVGEADIETQCRIMVAVQFFVKLYLNV